MQEKKQKDWHNNWCNANNNPHKNSRTRSSARRVFPAFSTHVAAATTQEVPPIQTGEFTIIARVKVVYAYSG